MYFPKLYLPIYLVTPINKYFTNYYQDKHHNYHTFSYARKIVPKCNF